MREREREKVTRHSDANSYSHDSASASASLINNNLIKLYESEIGTVTGMMSEKLMAAWDEYPHEWFEPAFGEAVRNNARKWNYVEAILKNWKAHGFQSKNGKQQYQGKAQARTTNTPDVFKESEYAGWYVSDVEDEQEARTT